MLIKFSLSVLIHFVHPDPCWSKVKPRPLIAPTRITSGASVQLCLSLPGVQDLLPSVKAFKLE